MKIEYVKGFDSLIEIKPHGNKKTCNKNMMEINPTVGCQFGCRYCNAYSQDDEESLTVKVYVDYAKYLKEYLEKNKEKLDKIFFYFSPKIDALQECLVESGITAQILKLLKEYNARYIIVTKGGIPNEEICNLLIESREYNQILISCSMPNDRTREILEPDAASIKERMEFAKFCIDNKIRTTAIFSPILPINRGDYIKEYIDYYLKIGITHFRLNFAEVSTYCLEELVKLLPEYKDEFLEVYLNKNAEKTNWKIPYKNKEINRYFPEMKYMQKTFDELRQYAKGINPSATFSVCNSLCEMEKLQGFNDEAFSAGFGCIGYRW